MQMLKNHLVRDLGCKYFGSSARLKWLTVRSLPKLTGMDKWLFISCRLPQRPSVEHCTDAPTRWIAVPSNSWVHYKVLQVSVNPVLHLCQPRHTLLSGQSGQRCLSQPKTSTPMCSLRDPTWWGSNGACEQQIISVPCRSHSDEQGCRVRIEVCSGALAIPKEPNPMTRWTRCITFGASKVGGCLAGHRLPPETKHGSFVGY